MLFQFDFVRWWETTFILFVTLWNVGTIDSEKVVEVNEEDLNDHGININPSDLDFLLPVVHPLPASPTSQISTQNNAVRASYPPLSSGKQPNNNTFLNTVLKFAKPLSTQSKKSPKIPMKAKPRGNPGDHNEVRIQSKDELNEKQVTPTIISGRKLARGKLKQKEVYYNVYDRDEPVVIKKKRKPPKLIPKDKQEILNNTLSIYGLRLDSKGETVILKDEKKSPERRNRQKEEKEYTQHHKTIVNVTDEEQSSKIKDNFRHHHNKKANEHDMIKSLWDIFKSVSRTWK